MRLVSAVISVLALLAVMIVAGCVVCSNSTDKTGTVGGSSPTATATGTSTGSLPVTPGDLTDMKYLWNNVHYLHQTSSMTSTIPDMNGQETSMSWKLSDSSYKGEAAKLLNISINSSADRTKVDNSFSFNMGFGIYFSKAGDLLTMLGGQAFIDLGGDIMQGDLNVSQLVEQSRITGHNLGEADENVTVDDTPRFSPTINLSQPLRPISSPEEVETIPAGNYDMNAMMSAGATQYQGFGNLTLTPAGRETLKVGNRNFDCYRYTWTVNLNGIANYTVWYSPEFPAQPLKTEININNGERVQTVIVDAWN